MDEIQNLSKQIDFHSLTYYFKDESYSKHFINLKGALAFYRNVKVGYITLGKAIEVKKIKSEINKKLKGRYESKDQKYAIKSIKTLCELSEKVIKLFKDYCEIVFQAKYKSLDGEGSPLDLATRLKI